MLKWFQYWREEAQYIYEQDPAAKSWLEVFFLYPGIKARRSHQIAQWFYRHNHCIIARWLSERSKRKTGIEIHPGAQLGRYIFIDHGTGIVIGETAEVGEGVTIFHGVTLGGRGHEKGEKRHPTVKNNVILGTGSILLGDIVIGEYSKVGANAVVLDDVPAYTTVVGVPAKPKSNIGKKSRSEDDPTVQ